MNAKDCTSPGLIHDAGGPSTAFGCSNGVLPSRGLATGTHAVILGFTLLVHQYCLGPIQSCHSRRIWLVSSSTQGHIGLGLWTFPQSLPHLHTLQWYHPSLCAHKRPLLTDHVYNTANAAELAQDWLQRIWPPTAVHGYVYSPQLSVELPIALPAVPQSYQLYR